MTFQTGCGAVRLTTAKCRNYQKMTVLRERPVLNLFSMRLAGTWTYWGWKGGYFDTEEDAETYFDEMRYILCAQSGAPNSPQWFNTGLHWAYGIDGHPKDTNMLTLKQES